MAQLKQGGFIVESDDRTIMLSFQLPDRRDFIRVELDFMGALAISTALHDHGKKVERIQVLKIGGIVSPHVPTILDG